MGGGGGGEKEGEVGDGGGKRGGNGEGRGEEGSPVLCALWCVLLHQLRRQGSGAGQGPLLLLQLLFHYLHIPTATDRNLYSLKVVAELSHVGENDSPAGNHP